MEKLGYGPNNPLKIKISASDIRFYRDPAVVLIDQLRQIYIDAELEAIDTTRYYPKIMRQEYTVGLNLQTSGPDPDPILDLFYGCGSSLNWDGYCNHDVDKLIEQQSLEGDPARRKQILWQIERKLAEEDVRPIIFYADRRHLHAALRQGPGCFGQQHLQRGAPGRRLARQISVVCLRDFDSAGFRRGIRDRFNHLHFDTAMKLETNDRMGSCHRHRPIQRQ